MYCRYDSTDPLDLGEALWLAHWGLGGGSPGQQPAPAPWARVVSRTSLAALGELWDAGYFTAPRFARLAFREFGATLGVQVRRRCGEAGGC